MNDVILDATGTYFGTVFWAIIIGLSQLMIGGTVFIVFLYSFNNDFKDIHIFLCTIGYNFFCLQGILSLNFANGWSLPIKLRHRAWTHGFLIILGLSCAITGSAIIIRDKGYNEDHGKMGLATMILAILSTAISPGALISNQYLKIAHETIAIPTFITSSICFAQGLLRPSFKNWAGSKLTYILVTFVIFYTTFIFLMAFMKYFTRITMLFDNDEDDEDD